MLTPLQTVTLITTVYIARSLDILTTEMLDKVPDAFYLSQHISIFTETVALCSPRALTIFPLPSDSSTMILTKELITFLHTTSGNYT